MQIVRALQHPHTIEDDAWRRALRFDRIPFSLSPSDGYKVCSQEVIPESGSCLCLTAALKSVDLILGTKGGKKSALRVFLELRILVRPA